MKAPDKVFFSNDINLLTKLSLVIKQKGDVCYIRKDVLLEWVKIAYGKLSMNPFDVQNVFEELIDKLNAI